MALKLNIDIPTKTAVVHSATCSSVRDPRDTAFKGDNAMLRDGGWFDAGSYEDAAALAREAGIEDFAPCSHCLG